SWPFHHSAPDGALLRRPGVGKARLSCAHPEGAPRHLRGDPLPRAAGRARRDAPPPGEQPQALPEARGRPERGLMRVLITGAAGDVGSRLTALLRDAYSLRLSDVRTPAGLAPNMDFVLADLADPAAVAAAVRGIEGIVHLGGFSVEGPWETILNANIIGCYNL